MKAANKLELAKLNVLLRLYGMLKIPMVAYVRPRIVETNAERVTIKIPLNRRTKNHLGSMYFGALASAADLTAGFLTMHAIKQSQVKVSMVFKSCDAQFIKRIEQDAFFTCEQGTAISKAVQDAAARSERVELPVTVTAAAKNSRQEPAAVFKMLLSLKKK